MKFLYISLSLFFLSLWFLFGQGIYNNKFYKFKDRKIIVERTLYEQFSYEVYSSIETKLPFIYLAPECGNDDKFDSYLNLETYFDCKGIFSKDLNSNCQDTIVRNDTFCRKNGLIDLNLNNLNNILDYDERAITQCKYYSKFTRKITKLSDQKSICDNSKNNYTYEYFLVNSTPFYKYDGSLNSCPKGFFQCGILDTKNNLLCLPNNSCPNNSFDGENNLINNPDSPAIISIIISENQPLNHEWDQIVIEYEKRINDEESNKRRDISIKDFMLFDTGNDYTYKKIDNSESFQLLVEDIKKGNIIEGIKYNEYNLKQNLNIYTRNYIGFKDVEELNKFKKRFNNKDFTDSPLYKLSNSGHNPLITIIIPIIFIVATIIYFILNICKILKKYDIEKPFFLIFAFIIILFLSVDAIIIGVHFGKYPTININMDERMKKVLDSYNQRTLFCQIYRIISFILNFISLIFIIISYFREAIKFHEQ